MRGPGDYPLWLARLFPVHGGRFEANPGPEGEEEPEPGGRAGKGVERAERRERYSVWTAACEQDRERHHGEHGDLRYQEYGKYLRREVDVEVGEYGVQDQHEERENLPGYRQPQLMLERGLHEGGEDPDQGGLEDYVSQAGQKP
jgi:hypothetical protein